MRPALMHSLPVPQVGQHDDSPGSQRPNQCDTRHPYKYLVWHQEIEQNTDQHEGCRDVNRRCRKVSPVDRAKRGWGLAYLCKSMKHSPGAVEPLLQDDIAAVMTTKLTMSAAPGMPIRSKTRTNGLVRGSI